MSPLLRSFGAVLALLAFLHPVGCNSDASAPRQSPDAGNADARARQPFNGDCSSARWADVSDACWSCFCNRCATSLNACDDACMKGVACANEKHTLVGVSADISCELRAFTALCLSDPSIAPGATGLLAFDTCLISSHDPATEQLRACEAECGMVYTGDVCQRFPAPDGG